MTLRPTCLLFTFCCLLCCAGAARGSVPVIYCTDLFHPHDDPDDHFDLAVMFALPAVDLRAIVLDQGDKQRQHPGSIPVSQLMRITGRQVPVAIGLSHKLQDPTDRAMDESAEFQQGVELILKTLCDAPGPVSIVTVGSVRDVVAAPIANLSCVCQDWATAVLHRRSIRSGVSRVQRESGRQRVRRSDAVGPARLVGAVF